MICIIHEDYKFNGSNELLAIINTIVSGFTVPLKYEHVDFFKNVLIPLYKV